MTVNISTELPKEKLYAAAPKQQQNQQQAEQKQAQIIKQDPNMMSGIQWANQQAANPQVVQQAAGAKNGQVQNNAQKTTAPEILAPSVDDVAILTTTVSVHEKSISALIRNNSVINFSRLGLNMAALEQSFREIYKKSKSHNLLLERFMSNVKLGGLNVLLGLAGVPAENIDQIKAEVREEALKEIDTKLSQDWAYTKAMIDITGGA